MPLVQWMETLLLRMKGAYLYRMICVLHMLLDFMSIEARSVTSVVLCNHCFRYWCRMIIFYLY